MSDSIAPALNVWDNSTIAEQREMATGLFEAVAAYQRTKDVTHLTNYAESVTMTVRVRQNPDYVASVRASAVRTPSTETVDVHEMLRDLGIRT